MHVKITKESTDSNMHKMVFDFTFLLKDIDRQNDARQTLATVLQTRVDGQLEK